jgi:hypothetical protein
MGHSCDDGWDTKPKLDEARVLAPESPPHRSRKDRRKWCRGKVGVVHQPGIRLSKFCVSMQYSNPESAFASCHWRSRHRWRVIRGVRWWVASDEWLWSCQHEFYCVECGKILRDACGKECPEWKFLPVDAKCGCRSCERAGFC